MASPIPGLQKVGRFWHYFLQVNGQRVHGSTRATDLATAKKILEEKRRELLEGQHRIISRIPTLRAWFDHWWDSHQAVFSHGHLGSVRSIYWKWIDPRLGNRLLDQVTTVELMTLRGDQLAAGCSPRFTNNTLQLVKTLLNYGIKLGYIRRLPFAVKPLRIQQKPRPTVPANQVRAFLASAEQVSKNPHVGMLLSVLVGLGLRESEALGMRWEWIDCERMVYQVGRAKGREARIIPIPAWLWRKLIEQPRQISEWVFPAHDGKPHRSGFLKKPLQKVAKALGLGHLTQHRLRATYASLHAEAGTPISDIQGLLGHKSISTTMIYVETSLEARRRAQDTLSQKLGLA